MTQAFDALQEEPQTGLSRGQFAPEERAQVRVIEVASSKGRTSSGDYGGSFTTVYYIAGDESAAARVFSETNADTIERIDFSAPNILSSNLPRELYDLVLHHAGERVRELYPTVVREDRPNGVTWVLDREYYEATTRRRYSITSSKVAKVPADVSLEEIVSEQPVGEPILPETLERADIKGGVRQVLDYLRVATSFECTPTTVDGQIAVVPKDTAAQA